MIKLVAVGLWVCVVTLAASYGTLQWLMHSAAPHEPEEQQHNIEEVRTKAINVPIIADGSIQGYVVAQFVFTIDSKLLSQLAVKPDVFLLDEAFKTIYAGDSVNFRQMKKQDLPALAKQLAGNVNKRLGAAMIQDVLIDQLNYVTKEEVRGGQKH
ncbi:MAG TPA: hypothetical protein VJ045_10825 [Hyphomicrobiaceae bacterium]|nr:hypothetical protein [Hyphomicrobiaceae bacterium]